MKVIFSSALVHMKQAFARSMFRYCIFLNPLCNAFLLGMIYTDKSDAEFTLYAILGTALSSFWTIICFSSAGDINREKYLGTLPVLFIAPAGFRKIIFGKLLGNSLWGLISFVLNILFVVFLFGRTLVVSNIIALILFVILSVLTFVSLGLLMCSAFTLSRLAQLLMNTVEYPLLLITGMVFPSHILWEPFQWLGLCFSPTWVMKGFKLIVYGGSLRDYLHVAFILCGLTMINFGLAYFSFVKIEKRCRIDASLEVY
ncbi:ABC transporter permease [Streptococcus caprae]|uniref:ABC transporter permease n=1 Tax=Streptococcus caprae TaxID=1640501 RepID=A0ABV8CSX5_9STRE